MDKEFEKKYHKEEKNNWWFKARRHIILQILDEHCSSRQTSILDVGCSGGALLKDLTVKGYENSLGADISQLAVELCQQQGLKVDLMDGSSLSFEHNRFDVLIASDILEHVENDGAALKSWYDVLKPGGLLIIFVPAFMFLWSNHDEVNHHFRRYSSKGLINLLVSHNFLIIKKGYWNFMLFFPVALTVWLEKYLFKNRKQDRLYHINPWLNRFLLVISKFENQLIKLFNFPFGMSIFIIARKK